MSNLQGKAGCSRVKDKELRSDSERGVTEREEREGVWERGRERGSVREREWWVGSQPPKGGWRRERERKEKRKKKKKEGDPHVSIY